ncbi:chemotaxis protein CheW [Bacillus toyonensis]|uniref:chemotaxis protein CheW n=1 Tax=Bacillus toyonensis TaxID=155322 RepID=UPI002E209B13|nr:chemotaxis protein CheW [Bacillus toyonensis]
MNDKYLVFSWMGKLFATSIDEVVEVLDVDKIVKTSRAEMKLTFWNNRTLPVIDTVALLSIEEAKLTKESKVLVIQTKNMKLGFIVEKIIGIEEFKYNELKEPYLEKQFIKHLYKDYKIVDFSHFVSNESLPLIKKAFSIDVNIVLNGEEILLTHWNEKQAMIDKLKLESLNFLIESNRRKLDRYYIDGMIKIHKMIEKM